MLDIITNTDDTDQTAFSDYVCTVCLGLFGRQLLVFEILEQLPYTPLRLKTLTTHVHILNLSF